MPPPKPWLLIIALTSFSFALERLPAQRRDHNSVKISRLSLTDQARGRLVPVALYTEVPSQVGRLKPAILSHGYGAKNTDYAFIATYLATHGYCVASIQHEIAGDEPLPTTGKPYETRMPSWQRGVQNVLFVLDELKRMRPDLDYGQLLLLGHSHGGDTSMLFAHRHPALVRAVISLDNRRMPFPRVKQPRLFSIRSSDQPADDGVIPSPQEQTKLGIRVVTLPATAHNDMWDGGTEQQKTEIIRHIDGFLREIR